ncbi:hypothetical protein ACHAW6_008768 [Cyclotella cf. meneghiniana]
MMNEISLSSERHSPKERHAEEECASQIMTGGRMEEEGIFGMSVHLVVETARFTAFVASAALGVVTDLPCGFLAGRLLWVGSHDDDDSAGLGANGAAHDDKTLRKKERTVDPLIFWKMFRSIVPRVIGMTFSPMDGANNVEKNKDRYLSQCNEKHSYIHAHEASPRAHDGSHHDHDIDSSLTVHTDSTSSLSTLSEQGTTEELHYGAGGSNDNDNNNNNDKEYKEFVKMMLHSDAKQSASESSWTTTDNSSTQTEAIPQTDLIDTSPQSCPVTYYLNFSSLLAELDQHKLSSLPLTKDINNNIFFLLNNSLCLQQQDTMQSFSYMLDALVQNALQLTHQDSFDIPQDKTNTRPLWKPEGDTKHILQRLQYIQNTTHPRNRDEEYTHLLQTAVLKWTATIETNNEQVRMIKTRGIVDMSPLELKDLLIDCRRGHLINKNSLGKRDVCVFPCPVGTTTIVENTLKIPLVGGEICSLSLTHSRPLRLDDDDKGGYVIVSKSVQSEWNTSAQQQQRQQQQLPYYSVSVLRPVGEDAQTTDLVNVAQIAQVPVPKFLVNKIAFTSAVDFFSNLRRLGKGNKVPL